MINKFSVAKALYDFLNANTSLTIAVQGVDFTPEPDEFYLREMVLYGDTNINVGGVGSDNMRGIYQIDVCTPISQGKWNNLNICNTISALFTNGLSAGISHNSQPISIQQVDLSQMRKDETHIIHSLSVTFRVVG